MARRHADDDWRLPLGVRAARIEERHGVTMAVSAEGSPIAPVECRLTHEEVLAGGIAGARRDGLIAVQLGRGALRRVDADRLVEILGHAPGHVLLVAAREPRTDAGCLASRLADRNVPTWIALCNPDSLPADASLATPALRGLRKLVSVRLRRATGDGLSR